MGKLVPQVVNIIATRDENALPDKIAWGMEDENGNELESLIFCKNDKGMKVTDHHLITFKLMQQEGLGLIFAPDCDTAMWVNRGTANDIPSCPVTQPTRKNAVFHATASNGDTLTVLNKNPQKCFYKFSLNFVKPGSTDSSYLHRYDPIGDNRNGGSGSGFETWAVLAGLGAVAALGYVAYLAFYR